MGPSNLWILVAFALDLEAEAESDSAANRATLRGGEPDPSSTPAKAVGIRLVKPSEERGRVSRKDTLVIFDGVALSDVSLTGPRRRCQRD